MKQLGKTYVAHEIEDKLYEKWISNGLFDRKIEKNKEPFAVLMPPPNVTGVLHMGHLLNQTLQDVFVRRARHENKNVTWVAGTDHAGISMQVKVEKELAKDGINWKEIGREKFLEYAKSWRDKHGGVILSQLKKLGVSCDFKNAVHTLDDGYSRGVLTAFVELYKRGHIYRGRRMVNWCPVMQTAISDEEVIMTPQKSKLYYVCYEVVELPGKYIEIATTRPETIMGDVAIAVNPNDEKYSSFIGMHCKRPLNVADIPIISDDAVDKDFGTGALKITPAHDFVDFEIGQRHNLPFIDILNDDGTLNDLAGEEFAGMDRFVARDAVANKLKDIGALIKVEDYENNVGFSERGHVPIEPRVSKQWFLKYPKVDEAKRAVSNGFIKFFPERWTKTYLFWLNNIQDWCISRQLWWGHRIPVWYRKGKDREDPANWHVSIDGPDDPENWEQDDDVLDTWASSWLWPFGVFGWPDEDKMKENGLSHFLPTNVLVTGPDIIFFWVSRMIIASLEFIGDRKDHLTDAEIQQRIPFKNVYFTGIIRDKLGRKMSKSLGNSPEPLQLIEKYGADGLRLGILMSSPNGQDLIFNEDNLSLGRNFCNKLWNAFRFSRMNREYKSYSKLTINDIMSSIDPEKLDIDDHYILIKLIELCSSIECSMNVFDISSTISAINNFFWNDYCSWYVELSKYRLHGGDSTVIAVHDLIFRQLLLILNPFIPFITDELWCSGDDDPKCCIQDVYCETSEDLSKILSDLHIEKSSVEQVLSLQNLVCVVRGLIAQSNCKLSNAKLYVRPSCDASKVLLEYYIPKLKKLIIVNSIELTDSILQSQSSQSDLGMVFIEFESANDVANIDRNKVLSEIERLTNFIKSNEEKLNNENFIKNAPSNVVKGAKKLLADNIQKRNEWYAILKNIDKSSGS